MPTSTLARPSLVDAKLQPLSASRVAYKNRKKEKMPSDSWGSEKPTIAPHGTGFSIPITLVEVTDENGTHWEGVRIEVRSLTSVDITAGVTADHDAPDTALAEALSLALDQTAPTIQSQIDDLTDTILGGM